jgi:glucose-6-phosphate isomerase
MARMSFTKCSDVLETMARLPGHPQSKCDVVNIGIGGSDLGPPRVTLAFRTLS